MDIKLINTKNILFALLFLSISITSLLGKFKPDQFYYLNNVDSMLEQAQMNNNVISGSNKKYLQLEKGASEGSLIFSPQISKYAFNRGLPSWNGHAKDSSSAFKIQIRFYSNNNWSPWLTLGYWKYHLWSEYGKTSFAKGKIDYDYVKLDTSLKKWQFKIIMKRQTKNSTSPKLESLHFYISDSAQTDNVNIPKLTKEKPKPFFIPAEFLHQHSLDEEIGSEICSPTTVSMILKSYNSEVKPLQFAKETYDPYYKLYGIWPRIIQHAHEYGLTGVLTRYRSWKETRKILEEGGRIAISVGSPLYSGHLMMLAGFDQNGNPIIHDPAKEEGYRHIFDKSELSKAWFEKGGISYTFFPTDNKIFQLLKK